MRDTMFNSEQGVLGSIHCGTDIEAKILKMNSYCLIKIEMADANTQIRKHSVYRLKCK